jgi:hypothetical protein
MRAASGPHLEFDGEAAIERLKTFGRKILAVPKDAIDRALAKEKTPVRKKIRESRLK